jgi:hypothetical protein
MRRLAPAIGSLLLAVGLLLGRGVAIPDLAVACSCVGPQPLAAYAGEDTVIFAGQVVGDDADGVRVAVEQWFSGEGAAPVILIAGDFGNGASCGVGSRPPVASRWIWVAWRPPQEGLANPLDTGVQVSICQPTADLATPEGEALLEEAVATFGGEVPAGSPGTPEAPAATPDPSPAPGADGPPAGTIALVAAVAVTGLGALLFVGILVVARRSRPSGGGRPG